MYYNDEQNLKQMQNIYDAQMSSLCLKIKKYRQNFIDKLAPYAKMVHEYLTDKKENILNILDYLEIIIFEKNNE